MEAMSTVRTSRTVIDYTGSPLASFSLAWLRRWGVASSLMGSGSSTTRGVFAEQGRQRSRLVLEPVDRLDLQVLLQAESAHRATDAGPLVAAHRGVGVRGCAVEADPSGPQAVHHPSTARPVTTEDVATEPVGRVVGDPQGVFLVAVGQNGQDGAEDLLPGDRHVRGDPGEHRRLDEVPGAQTLWTLGTTGDQAGALVDTGLDEITDGLQLGRADDRAHGRRTLQRVAEVEALRLVDEEGHHLVQLALVHQHATGSVAGLTGVLHATLVVPTGGLLEVGVGQHDVGRLSAQLEADALHRASSGGPHLRAGAGGAGEGDHVHARVTGQSVPHVAAGP